jgi:hypothetical protein
MDEKSTSSIRTYVLTYSRQGTRCAASMPTIARTTMAGKMRRGSQGLTGDGRGRRCTTMLAKTDQPLFKYMKWGAYLTQDHQKGLHQERELKMLSEPEEAPGDIGQQPGQLVGQ